jgi:hypothetical protein
VSPSDGNITNDNTVDLDWSDVSDLSTPVSYQVKADNNSDFSSPEYDSNWINVSNATTLALAENTYYWRARARDGVGNIGGWSAVWRFTVDTIPPASVANLAVIWATVDSVILNWNAPGDDGNVGNATTYDIRYSTSPITEANWPTASQCTGEPTPQLAGSLETFVVPSLAQSTTYYFALKTADEVPNWSALSNVVQGVTWDYIFEDPVHKTTLAVNTHNRTFQFTAPDGYDSGVIKAKDWISYGGSIFASGSNACNGWTNMVCFNANAATDRCIGSVLAIGKYPQLMKTYTIFDPPGFE